MRRGRCTITKCHNSGDVLSDQETCNASEVNLGGIMGGIYNPEKWECKISDTDNTGHITEKQHSISRDRWNYRRRQIARILRSKVQQIMEIFNMP